MKKLIMILVLVLAWAGEAAGAEYTVCSSGCDYTTIQAAVTAISGDNTILVRTGTYAETVTFAAGGTDADNRLILKNYPGESPVIHGADTVTTWSQYAATNIYSASCAWTAEAVFEDDEFLELEEWNTNIATTAASMSAGEWTIDDANNLLYVWATDNADPDTHTMEVTRRIGILASDKSYITIDGLNFEKCQADIPNVYRGTINLIGGTDVTVSNCTFNKLFKTGVYVESTNNVIAEYNTFTNLWVGLYDPDNYGGDGLYAGDTAAPTSSPSNLIFRYNTCGVMDDAGYSITGQCVAVTDADGVTINNNYIYGGKIGIDLEPNTGKDISGTINVYDNLIYKYANSAERGNGSAMHIGIIAKENVAGASLSGTLNIYGNTIDLRNTTLGASSLNNGVRLDSMQDFTAINIYENEIKNAQNGVCIVDTENGVVPISITRNKIHGGSASSAIAINILAGTLATGSSNIKIFNNEIYNYRNGIDFNDTNDAEADVYHNIFYLPAQQFFGIRLDDDDADEEADIRNNIFGYSCDAGKYILKDNATSVLVCDYNTYLDTTGSNWTNAGVAKSWAEWQAVPFDANGLNADPGLADAAGGDFTLLPSSPCINAGDASIITTVPSDYNGDDRLTPEIGAYTWTETYLDTATTTKTRFENQNVLIKGGSAYNNLFINSPVAVRDANPTMQNNIFYYPDEMVFHVETGITVTGGYNGFMGTRSFEGTYTNTGTSDLYDVDPLFNGSNYYPRNPLYRSGGTAIGGITTDADGRTFDGKYPIGPYIGYPVRKGFDFKF